MIWTWAQWAMLAYYLVVGSLMVRYIFEQETAKDLRDALLGMIIVTGPPAVILVASGFWNLQH